MVKTRSMQDANPLAFSDAPASPSVTAGEPTRAALDTGYETVATGYPPSATMTPSVRPERAGVDLPRRSPGGSERSYRSTASVRERRRLQMEIQLAEIERRKLDTDSTLVRKRMELSMIEDDINSEDENLQTTEQVRSWLQATEETMRASARPIDTHARATEAAHGARPAEAETRRELPMHAEGARPNVPASILSRRLEFRQVNPTSTPAPATDSAVKDGRRHTSAEGRQPAGKSNEALSYEEVVARMQHLEMRLKDAEQRARPVHHRSPDSRRVSRSPTPRREKAMERLTEAITEMASARPPPRQAQELPIFSGAAVEWLGFKAAMRDSTAIYHYSRSENLARLRSCLRGEAKEAVAALLYTANDPEIIMRTLEQRFGRPETIIDRTLDELRRLPRPGVSAHELNVFAVKLQNIVCVLSTVDERGYLKNPLLAREVTAKLSPHLTARWCDYAEDHADGNRSEIEILSEFLMKEADRSIRYAFTSSSTTTQASKQVGTQQQAQSGRKPKNSAFTATSQPGKSDNSAKSDAVVAKCLCCGGKQHIVPQCQKYKKMSPHDKWEWLKQEKICFQCINSRHRRQMCRAKKCGRNGCVRPHHWSLHQDSPSPRASSGDSGRSSPASEKPETVMAATTTTDQRSVLLKMCPVIIKGPTGIEVETYALLDEGSTVTLIEEDLAAELRMKGPVRPINLQGIGAAQQDSGSRQGKLHIRGAIRNKMFPVFTRTIKNLPAASQTVSEDCLRFRHLKGLKASEVCYSGARARIIIGVDNWALIVSRRLLTGGRQEPIASLTDLGWIIHGVIPNENKTHHGETVLHARLRNDEEDLHEAVKRHFQVEALGVATVAKMTATDQRAIDVFKSTVCATPQGYQVGLPWKNDEVELPPSHEMALRRLENIEKKMNKDGSFKESYSAEIKNLLEKGYAEKCEGNEAESPRAWWLPHFAVTNPNKPGKVRLVFDAAAKSRGICLNDALLDGPDLLQSLPGVLFRFREEQVAVAGDIQEMFLRVKIRPEDQPAQLFLWREADKVPPTAFKMTSMVFGARSSPFLAHSVRNYNAEKFKDEFPRAYKAITKNHYMDDLLDSYATIEEARATIKEVRTVHAQANFNMRGWASNEECALQEVPESLHSNTGKKELGQSQWQNTLGLRWHAGTDQLYFNTALPRVKNEVKARERPPTKREALSVVMSIFDPLGLVSYFTIRARIHLQELWRMKIGWDEVIPQDVARDWEEWIADVEEVGRHSLPRCYSTGGAVDRQLHIFCDASTDAAAAAAYWRTESATGEVQVSLVAAKAKVAPLRALSVPRMELQAALLGARLARSIQHEHRYESSKVTFWSDSRTTLAWIRSDHLKLTPFVAHRVTEIVELTHPTDWRWVPTAENVADDATRAHRQVKHSNDRWFVGPEFLYEPEAFWPQEIKEEATNEEIVLTIQRKRNEALPDISRFSKFERLIRATAYVLLFIDACRKRTRKLKLRHIQRAENMWLRESQRDSYSEEIKSLKKGEEINKTSKIRHLDPILDDNGILRLRGRINAANVGDEVKRPIIMDGRHPLTKLFVADQHERAGHAGNERVVNNLRQRFWVTRLRPTVRQAARQCQRCQIRRAMPRIPPHGDLPSARLQPFARPFTYAGLDYFGPIVVTVGRRHEKRWGALFTCLTTRAVHLEIAHSLSTESAIMALRRMAARRGWPKVIYSDNGTNFRGADAELRAAYTEWLPHLRDAAMTQRTDWRFIPPGAPNQGGAWERLVRSVKTALAVSLNEKHPRDEVLHTVLAEAEHAVNGRPLTHVPVSIDDPEALTPNHFLIGSSSGLPATGPCEHANRHTWRASQALADEFWRRWIREYLPTLAPRGNASDRRENLKVGDIVVVVDPSMPRNVWPRGEVEETFPGPDGKVRSAAIRTKNGVFRRPVRKLAVLPVVKEGSKVFAGGRTVTDGTAK